ncbi:MAG TPA: hypothetical protein VGQ85_05590 [Candidatus Limnocylindrales bacterium]|nr:hypothetical protein [Candidatus Limnocylindrales bacterium]
MIDQSVRFQEVAEAAIATRDQETGQAETAAKAAARLAREAAEEDLARAPEREREALAKERMRLAQARAAIAQAEQAASQARDSLVTARVSGQATTDRAVTMADAKLATAKRDAGTAADIVERLETRMIANVRAERRKQATASLAEIAARWKAVSARIVGTYDLIEELAALHAAEEAAAHDLASASGEPAFRWSFTHETKIPTKGLGAEHIKTPELDISIVLGVAIVTRDELADRLRL